MTNKLTFSSTSTFMKCRRNYYLQYELGIRKRHQGEAMRIGSAVHAGLETGNSIDAVRMYDDVPPWVITDDDLRKWYGEGYLALAMVEAWMHHWEGQEIEIVANEDIFDLPLVNPDTRRHSRKFRVGGKLDKIVKLVDGRHAIMDHKTTSYDISSGADFWKHLRIDRQISMYIVAARRKGIPVDTAYYDVIRKPGIRVRKGEEPREFGIRAYNEMSENHGRYFARQEVPRLDADIEAFERELWSLAGDITEARRHGRWYRNCRACLKPYRCPYLDICGNDVMDVELLPSAFHVVADPHVELLDDKYSEESD